MSTAASAPPSSCCSLSSQASEAHEEKNTPALLCDSWAWRHCREKQSASYGALSPPKSCLTPIEKKYAPAVVKQEVTRDQKKKKKKRRKLREGREQTGAMEHEISGVRLRIKTHVFCVSNATRKRNKTKRGSPVLPVFSLASPRFSFSFLVFLFLLKKGQRKRSGREYAQRAS